MRTTNIGEAVLSLSILRTALSIGASILSGLLLFLIYPNGNIGWLAWVALVPLLMILLFKGPGAGFLLAYLCGIVSYSLIFYWLFEVTGYTPIHHAMLATYLGVFLAIFGYGVSFIAGRLGSAAALMLAPFLWVSLEYLRSSVPLMPAPWPLLGYSQHDYQWVIQIAEIGGVYGLSFVIAAANSGSAALLLTCLSRSKLIKGESNFGISGRSASVIIGVSGFLVIMTVSYGVIVCKRGVAQTGSKITVSLIQGNIEQKKKWDPKFAESIMENYIGLSREAAQDRPDLIVWPEAATPRSILQSPDLYSEISQFVQDTGAHLFLGSTSQIKFKEKGEDRKYRNSGFLIGPGTDKPAQYDKIILFPFGEFLPLKEIIPWHRLSVPSVGSYKPGEEYKVFECPEFRFGATICWENGFPGLVRQFVRHGAQFLINITNEAWFGRTASPYQFLTYNVFRAVENRRYVVRCTNTGVSCIIDPLGRVVDRVKEESGKDIFIRGYLTGKIVPIEEMTFYTRFGDWMAFASVVVSFGFIIWAFCRPKGDRKFLK
jgi:apolipoprotein N-acyltransferase